MSKVIKSEQEMYNFCEKTGDLYKNIQKGYLVLASRLSKIKKEEYFNCSQYGSWSLFLDSIQISRSKADQLIRIWDLLVDSYAIPEDKILAVGGWSEVVKLLPLCTDKKRAEEVLELATQYPTRDSRNIWIKSEINGEEVVKNCSHQHKYTLEICTDCGLRTKLSETN